MGSTMSHSTITWMQEVNSVFGQVITSGMLLRANVDPRLPM